MVARYIMVDRHKLISKSLTGTRNLKKCILYINQNIIVSKLCSVIALSGYVIVLKKELDISPSVLFVVAPFFLFFYHRVSALVLCES